MFDIPRARATGLAGVGNIIRGDVILLSIITSGSVPASSLRFDALMRCHSSPSKKGRASTRPTASAQIKQMVVKESGINFRPRTSGRLYAA